MFGTVPAGGGDRPSPAVCFLRGCCYGNYFVVGADFAVFLPAVP